MQTNNNSIVFSDIRAIRNVRIENNGRFLVPSILDEGIQERPWVTPIFETNSAKSAEPLYYEIIRGHCRLDAVAIIQAEMPEEFARLFKGSKVKVQIITDITADEKERLKMDFNRKNLTNEYEIQLAVNLLFDARCTEAEVANQLASMLGELTSDAKGKKLELEKMLSEEKDPLERINIQASIRKIVADCKRGKVQTRKAIYDCPTVVLDCLYLKHTGKLPDHYESGAFLPVLTGNDVSKLLRAFKKDLKSAAEGICENVTKSQPGACFVELFASISAEKRNKSGKADSQPRKAMSRAKIVEPIDKGQIESKAMRDVIGYHGANPDIGSEVIGRVDGILAIVECVQRENTELWDQCVAVFDSYTKRKAALLVKAAQKSGEEL